MASPENTRDSRLLRNSVFSLTGNAIHGIIRSSNDDGGECMERTEDINRQQPLFLSFDEMLPQDSMVRVIDRFIDVCNLQQMGFQANMYTGRFWNVYGTVLCVPVDLTGYLESLP